MPARSTINSSRSKWKSYGLAYGSQVELAKGALDCTHIYLFACIALQRYSLWFWWNTVSVCVHLYRFMSVANECEFMSDQNVIINRRYHFASRLLLIKLQRNRLENEMWSIFIFIFAKSGRGKNIIIIISDCAQIQLPDYMHDTLRL